MECIYIHVCQYDSCHGDLSLCLQPIPFPPGVKLQQLSHHPDGKHYLALSRNREVFAWGVGDNGRLGLGETR